MKSQIFLLFLNKPLLKVTVVGDSKHIYVCEIYFKKHLSFFSQHLAYMLLVRFACEYTHAHTKEYHLQKQVRGVRAAPREENKVSDHRAAFAAVRPLFSK